MTHSEFIASFPLLSESQGDSRIVFLDSAASSQKPQIVMDAMDNLMSHDYANVHRGLHRLSQASTQKFEDAREKIAIFLQAKDPSELVFVRGLTEGMNLLAQTFGRQTVQKGQTILLSEMEHHSNMIPWMILAKEVGASISWIPVNPEGELDLEAYSKLLQEKDVALISVMHVSNVLGTINPIQDMVHMAKTNNIPFIVDGAQAAPHMPVDVQALGCDFYVITGHKMFGPTGIGVLWGKTEHLQNMPIYHGGGEMVDTVSFDGFTVQAPPAKFEAGTPHFVGAVGLGAAVDFIKNVGWDRLQTWEQNVSSYAKDQLMGIDGLRMMGQPKNKIGVFSFELEGCPSSDVAMILDQMGVAVRVGFHCAEPLHQKWGLTGSLRASLAAYNTTEDVDMLIQGLNKALGMLR